MATPDRLIGQPIFGGYVISRRIGAGGMGAVYLLENRDLGKRLAMKVLLPERSTNEQVIARFLAEARAASAIRHRNIIDIIDSAQLGDGRHYILMEYLEGSTLRAFNRRYGPLPCETILAILAQVCSGLQAAHERGIVHRDLKPSNLLVVPQPENPYFTKVLDFGIAKLDDPHLARGVETRSQTVAGTPHYMAPEQARALRNVDQRADVYAVGAIAYELLTGQIPYQADTIGDLVYQQLQGPAPPPAELADVPPAWSDVVHRAIALDLGERIASARELAFEMMAATPRGAEIVRAAAPLLIEDAPSSLPPPEERTREMLTPHSWASASLPDSAPDPAAGRAGSSAGPLAMPALSRTASVGDLGLLGSEHPWAEPSEHPWAESSEHPWAEPSEPPAPPTSGASARRAPAPARTVSIVDPAAVDPALADDSASIYASVGRTAYGGNLAPDGLDQSGAGIPDLADDSQPEAPAPGPTTLGLASRQIERRGGSGHPLWIWPAGLFAGITVAALAALIVRTTRDPGPAPAPAARPAAAQSPPIIVTPMSPEPVEKPAPATPDAPAPARPTTAAAVDDDASDRTATAESSGASAPDAHRRDTPRPVQPEADHERPRDTRPDVRRSERRRQPRKPRESKPRTEAASPPATERTPAPRPAAKNDDDLFDTRK